MRHEGAAGGVEVSPERRCATEEIVDGRGVDVVTLHFPAQRLELRECDVAGAALGWRRNAFHGIGGDEGLRAFGGQVRLIEDVGRHVQVALGVTAHQLSILGERDVALQNPGAHANRRQQSFLGVFGELERGAAMGDGEGGGMEGPFGAGGQFLLEGTVVHVVDQVVRPWSQLNIELRLAERIPRSGECQWRWRCVDLRPEKSTHDRAGEKKHDHVDQKH